MKKGFLLYFYGLEVLNIDHFKICNGTMGLKFTSSLLMLFFSLFAFSQENAMIEKAKKHISENLETFQLLSSDIDGMVLDHHYRNERIGSTYIYFNQAIEGLPIKNAIMNVTLNKNGKVIHVGNNFVSHLHDKLITSRSQVDAEIAVKNAALHLGVERVGTLRVRDRNAENTVVFEKADFSRSPIKTQLMYDFDGEKVVKVWQATIEMSDNSDYWEIRMNAETGEFFSKNNLTVYCTLHPGQFERHGGCDAPSAVTFGHKKLTSAASLLSVENSAYKVYALPAESPSHGPHVLVENPYFIEASPFGWHDTDGQPGAEFTITRGNNVFAYPDLNNDNQPDADYPTPDGGSSLVFDFEHKTMLEPTENVEVATTNLFYMVNMIHDISYLYGFDEAAGNFQATNYTGQGAGNDFVRAEALDGFLANPRTLNNANFSTPVDGTSGRMQMYLWNNSVGVVRITSPAGLEGFLEYGPGNFGAPIPSGQEPPVVGSIAIGRDNNPQNPTFSCGAITSNVAGKIALIDRGECEFGRKVLNAQQAGAIAAIICNIAGVNGGDGEETINMGGGAVGSQVTIPSISLKKSDCDRIRAALAAGDEVVMRWKQETNTGPSFIDGSLDNGIIAHEFGHGISIRLTGGRNNSGCLNNDAQMGEGWSDFFSLVTTVRPGDTGKESRGIGTFALGQNTNGRGIRRYPYSTDMSINPQTFREIASGGSTAPHPVGEIWTDVLWDLYWALVDEFGYDADWRNFNSGNAKALLLVMEGMKLQPCRPGFIEGRDAILAADRLLFDGRCEEIIWRAFARRGLGYLASGDANNRNIFTESFEIPPLLIKKLKIQKTATELVEAGEEIEVRIEAVNHIPQRMSGIIITDEIPEGTTYVAGSATVSAQVNGDILSFEIGDLDYEQEITITYRLKTGPNKSKTLFIDDFEDLISFDVINLTGDFSWSLTNNTARSGGLSFGIASTEFENDHILFSQPIFVDGQQPYLRFWHRYDTEPGNDGGFVQVSNDGGVTWRLMNDKFLRNGYNSNMAWTTFPIPSLRAFTGSSGNTFIDSYMDLSDFRGQEVIIRWRFGSDEGNRIVVSSPLAGWFLDDVEIMDLLTYESKACITNADGTELECTDAVLTIVDSDQIVSTVKDNVSRFGMQIFPNPASAVVNIAVNSSIEEIANLRVYNIDGKLAHQSQIKLTPQGNIYTINTVDFAPGFYLVSVQSGDSVTTKKLIVR